MCDGPPAAFWGNVDAARQVPPPSGAAWLIDLGDVRGPLLVVLRPDTDAAIEAAVAYLLATDAVSDPEDARELLDDVEPQVAAVVW